MPKIYTQVVYDGSYRRRSTSFGAWTTKYQTFTNSTTVYSLGNKGWYKTTGDRGGPFTSIKSEWNVSPSRSYSGLVETYVVPTSWTGGSVFNLGAPSLTSNASLNASGATAIARVKPDNPVADLAVTAGEFAREGLPSYIGSTLFKERVRLARSAGSEYLNVQFGWLPLVSSLREMAYAVKHQHAIIDGYRQSANRKLRRRYVFPPSLTTNGGTAVGYIDAQTGSQGNVLWNTSVETELWFSGAFKCYLPIDDSLSSKLDRGKAYANKVLGIRLTPEAVWQLAPWSWAADWVANTGDVLANISSLGTDGLAMQYGYIMSQKQNISLCDYRGANNGSYSPGYSRVISTTKQRLPANPYGFGIAYDGLSTRQKAIVVALGLSRA